MVLMLPMAIPAVVVVVDGGHSEHLETGELTKLITVIIKVFFQLELPC